jgi:hypothetical protein
MLRLALVLGARSAGCDISQLWIVFTPLVGPYSIHRGTTSLLLSNYIEKGSLSSTDMAHAP